MANHNREKDYYETRARLTLERLNLFEAGYLVKSERPDFISVDGKYGIEVTRTVYKEDVENSAIFQKYLKCEQKIIQAFLNAMSSSCHWMYLNGFVTRVAFNLNLGAVPTEDGNFSI